MSNEQYLIVSYFAVGALVLAIAVVTYLWLRPSVRGIADAVPARGAGAVLRKLFFVGVVLPTLAGFLSVSFRSCQKDTYAKIVADRSYLVAKNEEQIQASLSHAVIALLAWGVILLVPLIIIKRAEARRASEAGSSSSAAK